MCDALDGSHGAAAVIKLILILCFVYLFMVGVDGNDWHGGS